MAGVATTPPEVLPPAGSAPRPARRRSLRLWLRWFGILCLVGAVGTGGYLAWLFWGTGIYTARAQKDLRHTIVERIQHPRWSGTGAPPPEVSVRIPGEATAIIQIPTMDLDMVVVEGIDSESLKKGPGHYPNTAMPWDDTGRVGIAGHRTTYAHPFWSLDKLAPGDRIDLLTEFGKFGYRVTRVFVIDDSEGWVLDPTKRPTLVLTTCHPRFSSAQRLIVFADRLSAPEA